MSGSNKSSASDCSISTKLQLNTQRFALLDDSRQLTGNTRPLTAPLPFGSERKDLAPGERHHENKESTFLHRSEIAVEASTLPS